MLEKKVRRVILFGIALFFLLIASAEALAQEEMLLYSEDFESGRAAEWELGPGWEVMEVEGGHVLSGQGHEWAIYRGGSWDDYRFRFKVRLDDSGSLHANFRLSDGPPRYFIGLNHEGLYLNKQTGPDDFSGNLATASGLGSGWVSVEISGSGATIRVRVNDQEVMSFTDPEPILSGGIAFESLTDSQVWIDDIEIWGTSQEPAEESPPPQAEEQNPDLGGELQISDLTWVRLGGPPGGLGYDIRYNFDDPNTWYVTDANAGVHISHDNGLTWQQSNTGIDTVGGAAGDSIPIFSLTVDPNDPQILWVGTDMSGRIYKSTDGGNTWTAKDQGIIHQPEILLSFRGFTVDPRTSETVYAMGELQKPGNNVWGLGVGGVVYKTTDGGDHWVRIWDGAIPASLARYMWIDPRDPDVLYVSTGIFDRGAVGETSIDTHPNPYGGLGVLKSTDGGQSWRVLGADNGLEFRYIGSLYMHPDDPDELFAAAGHVASELAFEYFMQQGHSPMGIYRTTDGGEHWQQVLEPDKEMLVQTFSAVEICPSNTNVIYAGSDGAIYRSQDEGNTWQLRAGGPDGWGPPGVRAGWPIDMQCDPRNPDRVFANNYSGGNFLSEDGGVTWVNASTGYSGAQIIGVAVDPFNPARVFAAGRSGVWYSDDGGTTWYGIHNPGETKALAGGEWGGVTFDPANQNHIILAGQNGFLEWVENEQKWVHHDPPGNYFAETSEIEYAPSDPQIVYAVSANHNSMVHADVYESGKGVAISRDGGSSWDEVTGQQFSDAVITDVAVDPRDANVVYVATQIGAFKSTDSGKNWQALVSLSQGNPVRSVAVSPSDSNRLLAGVQQRGLFISDDGGTTWRQVTSGLEPNGIHRDFVFDPTNPDVVYVGDITSGIYRSDNGGESWVKLPQGLTNRAVTSLSITSDGLHLYAGISGGGVFRLDFNGQPPVPTAGSQSEPEGSISGEPKPAEDSSPLQNQTDNSQVEEPQVSGESEEASPQGRFCGGAMVLPLAVAGIGLFFRRKRFE